jgi:hypothetical protein
MHNTCEDSLLAVPLIIDLAVLCEVCERIKVTNTSAFILTYSPAYVTASDEDGISCPQHTNVTNLCCFGYVLYVQVRKVGAADEKFERFHCVNSLLSYLLKAPMVPPGTPVVNALAAQRQVSLPLHGLYPSHEEKLDCNRLSPSRTPPVHHQRVPRMRRTAPGQLHAAGAQGTPLYVLTSPCYRSLQPLTSCRHILCTYRSPR